MELFAMGRASTTPADEVAQALRQSRIAIEMDLGVGEAEATALGCDLSPEYVRINADYSS
jgi:glutamate N-acetyltransferase/amino-acid N-acetyltransferase